MASKNQSKIKVSPSLAAGNLLRLESEVKDLEKAGADSIHFDVMDGHYVPVLTFGPPILAQVRAITSLPLDVHIMVSNPDEVIDSYLDAGANVLTFHPETAKQAYRLCTKIRDRGAQAGVALNPGTSWRTIEFLIPTLDQITIMTVNPGYSRQAHLQSMHSKIRELADFCKQNKVTLDIQVDGGVNPENAGLLVSLGATVLVAGGAVFNNKDYEAAISAIRNAKI